jgi:hypothetical protein
VGLEPVVEEFEVVPDFAGLVVAAVRFAFEDGYVGLTSQLVCLSWF